MANFDGLKFEVSDEPIIRTVGRKKQAVPADIKNAVAGAIKNGKTVVTTVPTSSVATLRRLLKQATTEAGNFLLKTQVSETDDPKVSIFRFTVEAKPSE